MRLIRLLFIAFTFLWSCYALLVVYFSFSHPDAVAGAMGRAFIPVLLFVIFTFYRGRGERKRADKNNSATEAAPPNQPGE